MSRPRRSTLAPSLRIGLYALDGAQRLVLNTLGVLSVLIVAGPLCALHFAPQSRVLDWVTIHFTQRESALLRRRSLCPQLMCAIPQ